MAQQRTIHRGQAVGGPADGQQVQSRFPRGFLLVDRPASRVWIYDFQPGPLDPALGQFTVREPEGRTEDAAARIRAALEPDYDVIAAAAVVPGVRP